jgi:hypothetical protein
MIATCARYIVLKHSCSHMVLTPFVALIARTIVLARSLCSLLDVYLCSCTRITIRCTHVLHRTLAIVCLLSSMYSSLCSSSMYSYYCYVLVRCAHSYLSFVALMMETSAQAQSRMMYVGPKGPGKNEKISRCSWIFMKLGDLKDPIFLMLS